MFILQKERLVKKWPATVKLPADNGEIEQQEITLDLLILGTEDNAKLLRGDEEAFKRAIKGWSGIVDEHNHPLDYNDTNLEALLKNPFFVIAAASAYSYASNGQASEKNS